MGGRGQGDGEVSLGGVGWGGGGGGGGKEERGKRKVLNSRVLISSWERQRAISSGFTDGFPTRTSVDNVSVVSRSVRTQRPRRLITSVTKRTCPICLYIWWRWVGGDSYFLPFFFFKEAKPHFHACLLFMLSAYRGPVVPPSSLPPAGRMLDVSTANLVNTNLSPNCHRCHIMPLREHSFL